MPRVLSRIRKELLYSTVVYDGKGHVRKQIDEDNRKAAVIWSVVEIFFWIVCLVMSFNDEIFARTRVMFSAVGIIIGHIINKTRFERYAFAESAMELAELRNRFAYYDQLTNLQNRRAYSERIKQLETDMPATCCVVTADINGLKQINDTFGHSAGGELIIGAAECLSQCFEGVGEVYRLGGDEFCVIAIGT